MWGQGLYCSNSLPAEPETDGGVLLNWRLWLLWGTLSYKSVQIQECSFPNLSGLGANSSPFWLTSPLLMKLSEACPWLESCLLTTIGVSPYLWRGLEKWMAGRESFEMVMVFGVGCLELGNLCPCPHWTPVKQAFSSVPSWTGPQSVLDSGGQTHKEFLLTVTEQD